MVIYICYNQRKNIFKNPFWAPSNSLIKPSWCKGHRVKLYSRHDRTIQQYIDFNATRLVQIITMTSNKT